MKAKKKADKNAPANSVKYSLDKQVPDMKNGFSIQTNYGSIRIGANEAGEVADLVSSILERRLAKLEE